MSIPSSSTSVHPFQQSSAFQQRDRDQERHRSKNSEIRRDSWSPLKASKMAANRPKGYSPTRKRQSMGYDHWSPNRSKSSKKFKSDKFRSPRRASARSKSQQSPPRELSHSKRSACQRDDGSRKLSHSRSDIESLLVWRPPPNDRTSEYPISESKFLNIGKAVVDDSALTHVVPQSLRGLNSEPNSLARTGQSVLIGPPVSSAAQPFHSHSNYPPIGQHHAACCTTPQMADVPLQLPLMFQSLPSDLLAHFLQVLPPTSALPSLSNTSTLSSLNLHDDIRSAGASITSSGVVSFPSSLVTDGFSPTVSHPSYETDNIRTSPVLIPDTVSLTQIYETDVAERLAGRQCHSTRSNIKVVNPSCMPTSTTDSVPVTAPSRQCSLPNSTAPLSMQSQPNNPINVTDNHAQTSFSASSDLPIVQSSGPNSYLATSMQGASASNNICDIAIDFKAPSLSSNYVPLTEPYQVDCSKQNAKLEVTAQDEGTYSSSMIGSEEESQWRRRPNSQTKQKRKRSRKRHGHSAKKKYGNDGKRSRSDGSVILATSNANHTQSRERSTHETSEMGFASAMGKQGRAPDSEKQMQHADVDSKGAEDAPRTEQESKEALYTPNVNADATFFKVLSPKNTSANTPSTLACVSSHSREEAEFSVNPEDGKAAIQCKSCLDCYVDEMNDGILVQPAHSIQVNQNQTTNKDVSMKQGCSGATDFQIDGLIPGLLTAALVGVAERRSEENLESSTSNEESARNIEKASSKEKERKEREAALELSVTNCALSFNTSTSTSKADTQSDNMHISASTMTPNSPSLLASHRLPPSTSKANEPEVIGAAAREIEADQALRPAVDKQLESNDIVARIPSSPSKVAVDTALGNLIDESEVKQPTVNPVKKVDPQQKAIDNLLLLATVSDNQIRQYGTKISNSDHGSFEPEQLENMENPKQQIRHLENAEKILPEVDKLGEKITQTIEQDHLSDIGAKTKKGPIQSAYRGEHKSSNFYENTTDVEETDDEDVESDLETDKTFNEAIDRTIKHGTDRIEYLQSEVAELDVAESKCRDLEDSDQNIFHSEDGKENIPCWNSCTWDWNWGTVGEKKMRFYTIDEDEIDLDWDYRLDIEFRKEDAEPITQPVAKKTSKILDIIGIRPKSTRIRNLAGTEGNSNPIEQKQSQSAPLSRRNRDKPSTPSTVPVNNDCKSNPKPKSNQTSQNSAKLGDVASSSSSSDAEFHPNKSTGTKSNSKIKKRRLRAPRKQKQQAKDQLQAKVNGSQSSLKTKRNGRARSAAVKASEKIKGTAQPGRKRKVVASN